jgi:Protein of unknown function (DUF3489)
MKMIPAHSGTQLHLVGPAATRREAVPPNRQRVPPLISTTVALTNGPGRQAAAAQRAVENTTTAAAKTEAPQRPVEAAKAHQRPARKRAAVGAHRPDGAKEQARTGNKATGAKGARKAKPPATAREGSKKETVLALLGRSQGATLAEMTKATGWQPHSVRGLLSGALRKKMGLKVKSGKRDNGERVYSLRG